jgi:hypothetical protein
MSTAVSEVKDVQRTWAKKHGLTVDKNGYTSTYIANLLFPLNPQTKTEFEHGDGNEIENDGDKPAKMCALHSSSALAVNVFDYWRNKDSTLLASALGIKGPLTIEGFEKKFNTGLPGHSPNLDIVLQSADGKVAIESKFTEPYYKAKSKALPFKNKYFPNDRKLWLELGLPKCEQLSMDIQTGQKTFNMLDAPQLLKHILGLQKSVDKPRLLYLWYKVPGNESKIHQEEVTLFTNSIDSHIGFRSLTYQELFSGLRESISDEHKEYLHKLGGRYFLE